MKRRKISMDKWSMLSIAFFTCCIILFAGMTGNKKSVMALSPELQTEAMKQYERLEALRSGKLPVSRFAAPESVHRQESLMLPSDRDPADIVIRRTRALWNDLSKNKNSEVRAMEDELIQLEHAAKDISVANDNERKELYLKACAVRRQIAFANPLLDFNKLVFVTHKRNPRSEPGGDHMAGQYYGIHATKGEGLFILEDVFSNKVKEKNIINGQLPDGAYLSPELSFDGSKILFAYTEAEGYRPEVSAIEDTAGYYNYSGLQCSFTDKNAWHIYSINADGSGLHQLTSGVFNDFDPCWLPNGKIAFISDRRGGFGRCHMSANGGAPWFTYTLHRMDADGSNMERLSHHETCEWQPSILHDGNIVYTRWDYVDRGFFQAHHPWTTTPDGRNALSVHGNYPKDWKDRPCMEMDIRAIPHSQNLIATAAAHHGQTYGSIVLVNPQLDDDDAMAQVKLVTPDERFPETEYGYFCREASYSTPWPLSEDYYLCVFGYPELTDIQPSGSDSKYSIENYGIYLLDAFGNAELLYRDPKIACLSPIPLKARPTPPVIPDIVQPYVVDLNQPRLNLDRSSLIEKALQEKEKEEKNYEPAVVSIMNVYENRLDWPDDTKITDMRIIQVLPKSNPGRNNPAIGYGTEKNARVVLGTVPVEEDGSVCFYLRPYIPVFFQALDSEGRAVQSMRSDVYAAPKEQLTCIGCHENRKVAPPQHAMPIAMKRKPSVIKPEVEGSNPFSYARLVQPVLDNKCVSCHASHKNAPDLSGKADNDRWLPSYRNLKPYAFYYDGGGSFTESKTYPGKFGAMGSKLYQLLEKGHKNVKLTAEEKRRITLWLDCNSDFYGTYENLEAQRKGEIVRPILE